MASSPLNIQLPDSFSIDKIDGYIWRILSFLSSPLVESLILAHPNEMAIRGGYSANDSSMGDWWAWTEDTNPEDRQTLIENMIDAAASKVVPVGIPLHPLLSTLLHEIFSLQLPRDVDLCLNDSSLGSTSSRGMSPKKAHEIDKLRRLIDQIPNSCEATSSQLQPQSRLIVDVGAGQGYLSRRLAETPGTRVLALDGDESQTEGATFRSQGLTHSQRQRAKAVGNRDEAQEHGQDVTHRTLFITSDSLSRAIDEWILTLDLKPEETPSSVLVTGLHACGSLTPAVLRCFVDLMREARRTWRPGALALVGCCYNLMRDPDDFPLSRVTTSLPTSFLLTPNHLQLAAQCPAQWSHSPSERDRAALARRKIVWRALLARALHLEPGSNSTNTNKLGRLPDRAYIDWNTFVKMACTKMCVGLPNTDRGEREDTLGFQLELLHVLRALIGPVIESLIIVDRAVYLAEQVGSSGSRVKVRAINVFDQLSGGSARNVALVIEPDTELH